MPADEGSRTGDRRLLVAAVGVALAARVLLLGAITVGCALHAPAGVTGGVGARLGAALGKSDGVWYLGIAHHGYGPTPPVGPDGTYTHLTSLAFFPLYPLIVRAVTLTHLPYLGAALVVTLLAGVAATVAVVVWARPLLGERGALLLVAVWSMLPSSAVLVMAYSEALFVAAAAGCLLALQRNHWLAAGLAAAAGGLTRPTGGALLLAVAVAVLAEVRRERRLGWRPAAAVVTAAGGLAAALVHVAVATGRWDGWFWVERTVWRSGFDGGRSALDHVGQILTGGRAAHRLPEIVAAVVALAALALVVAVLAPVLRGRRAGGPDLVYAVAVALLAVGERAYFYVKPRLLFVAFPLLVPVTDRLLRLTRLRLVALGAPALLAALAYNAYLVVGWPRAL